MISTPWSGLRQFVAVTATIAVLGAFAALGAAPSQAASTVTTDRIAGNDRYATAGAVAAAAYPTGADTVLIASGRSFPDALAGAALAGRQGAPILLTEPGSLPQPTSDAITALKATKAVILGGPTAVSQAVQDELTKKVSVSRIAGTDRYDTAAKIGTAIGATNIGSTNSRRTALIATGLGFADALAGGALAAAGSGGVLPVLLVDSGIPAATRGALTELGIKQTIILGGTSAVSAGVANELQQITGNAPERLAGSDRYATATAIANDELTDFAFSKTKVLLANGVEFADALSAGALAGKGKTPILLTQATALPAATSAYLTAHNADVAAITAIGGQAAVSDAVLAEAKAAAQPKPGNQGITVTPADEVFQTTGTSRTYTASGLTGAVDVVLVKCDSVGDGTFVNSNGGTVADGTASGGSAPDKADTPASISTVNGAPNIGANNDYADDASPAEGKVTFQVNGPSSGTACIVPVVFADANSDDALNAGTSTNAAATEVYGLGGKVIFAPAVASAGPMGDRSVQSVTKGSDFFSACTQTQTCNTYVYDETDTFQISSSTVNLATFETALSAGDGITGTYQPQGNSTFNLTDSAPAAPSPISASQADGETAVTFRFSDSSTSTVDSYRIYRANGTATTNPLQPVDCSGNITYTALPNGTVADTGSPPAYEFEDASVSPGTAYCYKVSSIDDGDEGAVSTGSSGVRTRA